MRVLFFGQTGLNKSPCVRRLGVHCLTASGLPPDLDNIKAREYLRVFHLEDSIARAADYIAYLDRFYQKAQQSIWSSAWDSVMSEIKASNPDNVFITLHATYFRKDRFFSVINTSQIREFSPDMIITLIDDAYECWDRIVVRESERPRGTKIRLRDVFLWRTVEVMAGDFLVHDMGIQHYVVAIKHPLEMFRRLLLDTSRKRIYASFPISSTRESVDSQRQVDEFRLRLHREFTFFDPLTIDERVLSLSFAKGSSSGNDIQLEGGDRWPLGFEADLEPMSLSRDDLYPLHIPLEEVREAVDAIDPQIAAMDYRMIDQVQAVAAFRPNYKDHFARGVNAELLYAGQTSGVPVHVIWDETEDGLYGDSPFTAVGTRHANVDALISAVRS